MPSIVALVRPDGTVEVPTETASFVDADVKLADAPAYTAMDYVALERQTACHNHRVVGAEGYLAVLFANLFPAIITAATDYCCVVQLGDPSLHDHSLLDLPLDAIAAGVRLWAVLEGLAEHRGLHLAAFQNSGREAGATQPHPHSQAYLTTRAPGRLAAVAAACRRRDRCLVCAAIGRPELAIWRNEAWEVSAHPHPRINFSLILAHQAHTVTRLQDCSARDLAEALQAAVRAWAAVHGAKGLAYNVVVNAGLGGHLWLELLPKAGIEPFNRRGGYEELSGEAIVTVPPVTAAAVLREARPFGVAPPARGALATRE